MRVSRIGFFTPLALATAVAACAAEEHAAGDASVAEPVGPNPSPGADPATGSAPGAHSVDASAGTAVDAGGGAAVDAEVDDASIGNDAGAVADASIDGGITAPALGAHTLTGSCEEVGSAKLPTPTTLALTVTSAGTVDVLLTITGIHRTPAEKFYQIDPFVAQRSFPWSNPIFKWYVPQDFSGVSKSGSGRIESIDGGVATLVIRGSMAIQGTPYSTQICTFSIEPLF